MKEIKVKLIENKEDLENLILGDIVLVSRLAKYIDGHEQPIDYLISIGKDSKRYNFIAYNFDGITKLSLKKSSLVLDDMCQLKYFRDNDDSIDVMKKDNPEYSELKQIMTNAGLEFFVA